MYQLFSLILATSLSIFSCFGYHFTHLPLGNISPLFTFGQSIQRQGGFSLKETVLFHHRNHGSRLISFNHIYYGITDRLTFLTSVPIILFDKRKEINDHGLADISFRTEYVLFQDKSDDHRYNITLVNGLRIPTTTVEHRSHIASKTFNFFFGATQSLITPDWYLYSTGGYWIYTKRGSDKFGNELISDFGIGRTVFSHRDSYLIIFGEIEGLFFESDTNHHVKDFQSGEFVLFCGPTFRFKKNHWLLQGGVQFPIALHQKFIDKKSTTNFRAALSLAYTF